jgi:polysaccharide export outer membrane protein
MTLAAGCGGPKPRPDADMTSGADTTEVVIEFPEPQPYRLSIGDEMAVRFFYYPTYDVGAVVRPDGMVTIPLLGEVKAAGTTPVELEGLIRARYADVLAEPEVSVMVTQFASQRFFIFGEVAAPGAYPLMGNVTVMDAIAQSGNVNDSGRMDSIILMRKTPDGRYVGRKVDLLAKLSGRDAEVVYVAPTDVIFVPMSTIGKVDQFVDLFFNRLSPAWRFYLLGREVIDSEGQTIISK